MKSVSFASTSAICDNSAARAHAWPNTTLCLVWRPVPEPAERWALNGVGRHESHPSIASMKKSKWHLHAAVVPLVLRDI
jgi:hypothetical protein